MIFYDKEKVIRGDNTLFPRADHRWVLAFFLGWWLIVLFAVSAYYTAILTMYITKPYVAMIRAQMNEKTAYVLYKRGQE